MTSYFLGTMGYGYSEWRGAFYPESARPGNYLRHYSRIFNSVEMDTTFYGIPNATRINAWKRQVPEPFVFCPKTPREITHAENLRENVERMDIFLEVLRHFDQHLGVILVQFPPQFQADRMDDLFFFLDELPDSLQFAVEFRHDSWDTEALRWKLQERNISWVSAEYTILKPALHVTADFAYVRFLGKHGQFPRKNKIQRNLQPVLETWWDALRAEADGLHTVFAFFNDDFAGHAPASCNAFKEIAGLPVVRPDMPTQGRLF